MACCEKITPLIPRTIGIAIGALFIYAGILKALDPTQFSADIDNFQLLPHAAGVVLALYLPWLEIIGGAALILKKLHRGALLLLTALSLIFLAALASAKTRGLDITCGCFGHAHPHPLSTSIALDSALLTALISLLILEFKQHKPLAPRQ